MLKVENITSFYGEFKALDSISVEIKAGQTVIVVGANGSGKSTLLKSISGLLKPRLGSIFFEGEQINNKKAHEIVEMGIALVPEGGRLFPKLNVYDNLKAGSYTKKARKHFQQTLEEIFTLFPILKERQKQSAGLMSGGERQMLAIARSLMSQPKIVMLDEPSLGLAPKVVDSVFEFVKHMKENGYSILMVEQNAKKALDLADYGYLFDSGRLVFKGKKEDFDQNDYIKKAYLGL